MRHCSECRRPLSADSPLGVCPDCLFDVDPLMESTPSPGEDPSSWIERVLALLRQRPLLESRYEVREKVEGGGQGDVVRVRDLWLRRNLALKRLPKNAMQDRSKLLRFLQEAQISSQLHHPGLLPVFDLGMDADGCLYYTTVLVPANAPERLEGSKDAAETSPHLAPASTAEVSPTFRRVIECLHGRAPGNWTLEHALQGLAQVCQTLAYAHNLGVIHRDIKPSNILLGPHNDLYVIDWGSAWIMGAESDEVTAFEFTGENTSTSVDTTRAEEMRDDPASPHSTGSAGGPFTLAYIPPEYLGDDPPRVDGHFDVYSVGVILHQLLWGQLPDRGRLGQAKDATSAVRRKTRANPTPAGRIGRSLPTPLLAICSRAMNANREQRYPTMDALAQDLRAYLEARVVSAYQSGWWPELKSLVRRHKLATGLAALLVASLFASAWMAERARGQRRTAALAIALHEADASVRAGRWREVLTHIDRAEQFGYSDAISVSLRRVAAWAALGEHRRVDEALRRLESRSDLGTRRGEVLLRLAEHELFDTSTAEKGLARAREALRMELGKADREFALGLVAETSTSSLAHFHEALRHDPFHHGAHAMSLALELTLGQHEKLNAHMGVFEAFFPEDHTSRPLQILLHGMDGRIDEAKKLLESLHGQINEVSYQWLRTHLALLKDAPKLVDIEFLMSNEDRKGGQNELLLNAVSLFHDSGQAALTSTNQPGARIPQLPPMREGLIAGMKTLVPLALFGGTVAPGHLVNELKKIMAKHPEAMLPYFAGLILDSFRPSEPEALRDFLEAQTELFQMAFSAPSMMKGVNRVGRFLLAHSYFERATRVSPPVDGAGPAAVRLLQSIVDDDRTGPTESQTGYRMAYRLRDWGLAREFLNKWERLTPNDSAIEREWIRLETAANPNGDLARRLDRAVRAAPDDEWLRRTRQTFAENLKALIESK